MAAHATYAALCSASLRNCRRRLMPARPDSRKITFFRSRSMKNALPRPEAAGATALVTPNESDGNEHAIHRRTFLGAAREVHASQEDPVVEIRGGEDALQQLAQHRAECRHLLRERENADAPAHVALAFHAA